MDATIKEIIIEWLRSGEYDGLYNDGECACEVKQIIACDSYCGDCKPGYFQPLTEVQFEEYNYIIGDKKHSKIKCPTCNGTGYKKESGTCKACNGTGKRILHLFESLIPCPNQKSENGHDHRTCDHTCRICGGTQSTLDKV